MPTFMKVPRLFVYIVLCAICMSLILCSSASLQTTGSSTTPLPFRALLNSTPNISLQSDRATVYLGEHFLHTQPDREKEYAGKRYPQRNTYRKN